MLSLCLCGACKRWCSQSGGNTSYFCFSSTVWTHLMKFASVLKTLFFQILTEQVFNFKVVCNFFAFTLLFSCDDCWCKESGDSIRKWTVEAVNLWWAAIFGSLSEIFMSFCKVTNCSNTWIGFVTDCNIFYLATL